MNNERIDYLLKFMNLLIESQKSCHNVNYEINIVIKAIMKELGLDSEKGIVVRNAFGKPTMKINANNIKVNGY